MWLSRKWTGRGFLPIQIFRKADENTRRRSVTNISGMCPERSAAFYSRVRAR